MTSSPTPKAIAVSAIGVPSVPIAAIPAASAKFTPAPMKRPIQMQKAKAVPRTSVPNSSGSHRLRIAKFPPEQAQEEQDRHESQQRRADRQVERPTEGGGDRDHNAKIVEGERWAAADPFGQPWGG